LVDRSARDRSASDACHLTGLLGSWRLIYVNGPTRVGAIQIEPLWIWDRLPASHAAEHRVDLLLIEVHCRELLGSVPSPGAVTTRPSLRVLPQRPCCRPTKRCGQYRCDRRLWRRPEEFGKTHIWMLAQRDRAVASGMIVRAHITKGKPSRSTRSRRNSEFPCEQGPSSPERRTSP
jgi:hypothetical protein